jgi:hypothetical protein
MLNLLILMIKEFNAGLAECYPFWSVSKGETFFDSRKSNNSVSIVLRALTAICNRLRFWTFHLPGHWSASTLVNSSAHLLLMKRHLHQLFMPGKQEFDRGYLPR